MAIAKATIVTVEATTISQVAKTSAAAVAEAAAAAATTIEIWKVLVAQMHNSFGLLDVQLTLWQ